MLKIYFVAFTFIFSTNLKAQSNDQIGSKMADCSGWYFSASFVMRDAGNQTASLEYMRAGNTSLDISTKLIGQNRASQLSGVAMREYNQNKGSGTLQNWLPRLLSKKDECDAYVRNNNPQIRRALGQ